MKRVLFVAMLLLLADRAGATTPPSFSVQGVLRNNMGQLQSMALNVTVTLWNGSAPAATQLASYPNNMVQAQNGLFTVTLTDAMLYSKIANAAEVWMQLDVQGIGTFPRQQVTSQLFAVESASADGLRGVPVSSVAPTTGQVLQYDGTQWTPGTVGGGSVTSVTATAPLMSTGGATPNISLATPLAIQYGGTGSAVQNFVDLTTDQNVGGIKNFLSNVKIGNPTQFIARLLIDAGGQTGIIVSNATSGASIAGGSSGVVGNCSLAACQAVRGQPNSSDGVGVLGITGFATGVAVRGQNLGGGLAGDFIGGVNISGPLALATPLPISSGGTGSSTQSWVDLSTNQTISGVKTFNSNIVLQGGFTTLTNGTQNIVNFNASGVAPPSTSSVGWKLRLANVLAGLGIDTNTQWYVAQVFHKWFTTDGTTYTEKMSLDNAGNLRLENGTSNAIDFGQNGVAPPSGTSAGWKLKLFNAGTPTYGLGIDAFTQWYSANTTHRWYTTNGTAWTSQMTLDNTGSLNVANSINATNSVTVGANGSFQIPLGAEGPPQQSPTAPGWKLILDSANGQGIGLDFPGGGPQFWFTSDFSYAWYKRGIGYTRQMTLDDLGTLRVRGNVISNTTPDLAETIPSAPDVAVADVVCADPRKPERAIRCSSSARTILGVISDGTSSFLINSHGGRDDAPLTGKPLVLAGRVPVKVSLENGSIQIGDYLGPSSTPGVAMRLTQPGPSVGVALAPFDGRAGNSGTVLCFVKVGEQNVAREMVHLAEENAALRQRVARLEKAVAEVLAQRSARHALHAAR